MSEKTEQDIAKRLAEVEAGAAALRGALEWTVEALGRWNTASGYGCECEPCPKTNEPPPEDCTGCEWQEHNCDWSECDWCFAEGARKDGEEKLKGDAGRATLEELRRLREVVQSALTQLEETGCCPICEAGWRPNSGLKHVEGCPLPPFDKQEGEG